MCPRSSLSSNLQQTASLLSSVRTPMDPIETDAAWKIYKQLQRLLPLAVRTSDWTFKENQLQYKVPSVEFHMIYDNMMKEFETAEADMRRVLEQRPAAVRPLGRESLAEVSDFFILDNSLRETTVGVPRGHTYQEKHKIVDAIAESGLQEVILGAFGSKISVDSQVAARWTTLGQKFDHTWGFTSAYDMESYDQDALCDNFYSFQDKVKSGNVVYHQDDHDYYVPVLKPKATFSQDDLVLFRKAYQDFPPGTFHGLSPEKILKQSEHKTGRIPMGLLMMAGYGICNAIVEVDPTYGKFDAPQHDEMIDRLHFLIQWCQENLPKRKIEGESPNARIFVNFTDFANWKNSHHGGGLEKVMYMIHSLSSSAPAKRPFGYMMEDPTSWMFPDEMGKYVRMVRLMMDRVGHASGKFLVHIHMYFGLAEANVLACLANGADGVWAAMCKVGAQVGHACSTVTATNLVRVGNTQITEKYDLQKMCKAARIIHSVTTRQPCPSHEEVYGEQAFDVAFLMIAVPHCRFALWVLLNKLGVDHRQVRINELSTVAEIRTAMTQTFGPHELTGWDPQYCEKMWNAIHNHLLTGLSRDYNSPSGLGHLYGLVSKKRLPTPLTRIMLKHSNIPDHHPTVLEFATRWNRLCARYEGEELPLPGTLARSCMMYAQAITIKPRRRTIPFSFWIKDVVVDNHVMKPIPKLFKRYVVKLMTENEAKMQETDSPTVDFYDQILQLKLFILDAESLGVLPLVDDFSIRKNHDFFFGEDHLWLREVRGSRPRGVNQLLRAHFDFYPRFYTSKGNHALLRCVRSAAQRVADNKGITDDLQWLREGEDRVALDEVALDNDRSRFDMSIGNNYRSFRFSRAISTRGSTRVDKGAFIRFWTLASKDKHQRVLEQDVNVLDENEPVEDLRSNRQMANNGDLESTSREFYNRVRDIMTNQQEDQHFDDEFSRFLDFDAVAESVKDEESQNDRRGKLTLKAMKSRNQILREEGEKAESSVNNRAKKRNLWTRTRKILARKPTELSETTDKNAGSRA